MWPALAQPDHFSGRLTSSQRTYASEVKWTTLTQILRVFQRAVAKVIVGAVGPNAAQLLQATNFVSRSLLIQRFDEAQKGHGCNVPELTKPGVRSETGFSPGFPAFTRLVLVRSHGAVGAGYAWLIIGPASEAAIQSLTDSQV